MGQEQVSSSKVVAPPLQAASGFWLVVQGVVERAGWLHVSAVVQCIVCAGAHTTFALGCLVGCKVAGAQRPCSVVGRRHEAHRCVFWVSTSIACSQAMLCVDA
jgi:hypothetical protein